MSFLTESVTSIGTAKGYVDVKKDVSEISVETLNFLDASKRTLQTITTLHAEHLYRISKHKAKMLDKKEAKILIEFLHLKASRAELCEFKDVLEVLCHLQILQKLFSLKDEIQKRPIDISKDIAGKAHELQKLIDQEIRNLKVPIGKCLAGFNLSTAMDLLLDMQEARKYLLKILKNGLIKIDIIRDEKAFCVACDFDERTIHINRSLFTYEPLETGILFGLFCFDQQEVFWDIASTFRRNAMALYEKARTAPELEGRAVTLEVMQKCVDGAEAKKARLSQISSLLNKAVDLFKKIERAERRRLVWDPLNTSDWGKHEKITDDLWNEEVARLVSLESDPKYKPMRFSAPQSSRLEGPLFFCAHLKRQVLWLVLGS